MAETALDTIISGLRAAGEPTRLRLLRLLAGSELTVTELTQILGQSQPRVSRHLKLLSEAGLVDRFREGTWAFYRLADTRVSLNGRAVPQPAANDLAGLLVDLVPDSDPVVARDLARLAAVKESGALSDVRAQIILTYALCGFSNIASIGIQIGGIGSLAPNRRALLAQMGIRALIGGSIACFLTACVASMLIA